jgi:hypothetical protein
MPEFRVDVKAFINVTVEAPTAQAARREAERLVEACDPTELFINGWNDTNKAERPEVQIVETCGFAVDGTSDVECSECGDILYGGEAVCECAEEA